MSDICFVAVNENNMHYDCEMLGIEILYNSLHISNLDADILHYEIDRMETDFCKELADKIINENPRIVCFSPYFSNVNFYHTIAVELKKMDDSIRVFVGGGLCTYASERILEKYQAFDIVMIGEGEEAIVVVCKKTLEGCQVDDIAGIAYRKDDEIIRTQMRQSIVMNSSPSFERIMLERNKDVDVARINSARGCLASCTFCVESRTFKNNCGDCWRGKSPKKIVEEIKYIKNRYGIRSFSFTDNSFEDCIPEGKERIRRICNLIIEEKLDIFFYALVRGENFCSEKDIADIRLMRKAGMYAVLVGCETGYEPTLRLYGKRCSVDQARQAIENFHKEGIVVPIGFITFNPYSTPEEFKANLDFLADVDKAHYWVGYENRLQLYYGAPLLKKVERDGLLTKDFDVDQPYGYEFVDESIRWLVEFLFDSKYDMAALHNLNWEIMDFENLYSKITINVMNDDLILLRKEYDIWKRSLGKMYYDYHINLLKIAISSREWNDAQKLRNDILSPISILKNKAKLMQFMKKLNMLLKDING